MGSAHALRHRQHHVQPCAAASTAEVSGASQLMQERMEFLKGDLVHLFDDVGIDKSEYDDKVEFVDPITRYNKIDGYLFNIKFLKVIFDPEFILHDLRQTGDYEVTTRWTMQMSFSPAAKTPLRRWWNPKLLFTGVSIMGVNPETGKFNRHIDLWDSVKNQNYFSFEAFSHVLDQLGTLSHAPANLETPDYMVLRKRKDWEVRRYEPFLVAETLMEQASKGQPHSPVGPGRSAFNALAGYIFGKNERSENMKMTTPVFSDSEGRMQFVIGKAYEDLDRVPAPLDDSVTCKDQPGGIYAAVTFSGRADEDQVQQQLSLLQTRMRAEGLKAASDTYILARYNDPSTKPFFRRNDLLKPVENFELW